MHKTLQYTIGYQIMSYYITLDYLHVQEGLGREAQGRAHHREEHHHALRLCYTMLCTIHVYMYIYI